MKSKNKAITRPNLFSIQHSENSTKSDRESRSSQTQNITHLYLRGGAATIDSVILANVFGRPHKSVLRTIDELIADETISRHEFVPRNYKKRGREYRRIELNEAGFLKVMPFIGGRKSREGQKLLVDEFLKIKKLLAKQSKERETEAYQLVRSEGKDARKLLTDAIDQYIKYAFDNGSNNANNYYSIITKLAYKSFLIIEPKATEVRELLTAVQLSNLQTVEIMATNVLLEGIESNQPYKAIYQKLKNELSAFTLNKTKVLAR